MPTLYTYCLPDDNGSGPNPYWGICTLAICKPQIRRAAEVGDWIVGTGSRSSPLGDISGHLVYAMEVSRKITMAEYDAFTRRQLPDKIPHWDSPDFRLRLGDSIYDFSTDPPTLRRSVHTEAHCTRDLGGEFALLSDHFFYFGDKPVPLPEHLLPIVRQGQGYRSTANGPYFDQFVRWIHGQRFAPNTPLGQPQQLRSPGSVDLCRPVRPGKR